MIWHESPLAYAKYLAGYISDLSTIRARVKEEYGSAPSLDIIGEIRREALNAKQRVEGFQLCESRFRPLFKCGHEETEDNIITDINGNDKCRVCEEKRQQSAMRKEEERQARLRAQMAREAAKVASKAVKIEPVLERLMRVDPSERPRIGTVLIREVADFFNIKFEDIIGKDRHRIFIDARCVVAMIMRERGLSYPQIGKFMDRDHSTIINLMEKAPERIARNPVMLKALEALR